MQGKEYQEPTPHRFRWQLIPAATIGLIGCLSLIAGLFAGVIMAYIAITGQPLYEPGPTKIDLQGIATMLGGVAVGLAFIYAAKQLWRGYWLKSVLIIVMCVGVGIAIDLVISTFNSTPQHIEQNQSESGTKKSIHFSMPGTSLTVKLPHLPSSEHLEKNTELGLVDIQLYHADETISGSELIVFYSVAVNRYTDGFIDSIASEHGGDFLQGLAVGGLQMRPGSKIVARKRTVLFGLSGLAERVVMPGGRTGELRDDTPVVVFRHYYQDKDRVYLFQILTLEALYESAPNDFNRVAEEFFGSISK